MDREEFRRLALAELEAVHRMAFHLARREDMAADLVQETYLRALSFADRFEPIAGGMRPWLFKILHNVFYNALGKQQREPTSNPDADLTADTSSQDVCWDLSSLDWEQVDDRLKHAIQELPPHYREVLLMWAVEGMKYREIGDVLGVPIGTVMSRLFRARSWLSEKLTDLAVEKGLKNQPPKP